MSELPGVFDLEDRGRREQLAADLFQDGHDFETIAHAVELDLPDFRHVLVDRQLVTWEGDDIPLRIGEASAEHVGERFLFDVEILSVREGMTLPGLIQARCRRCEEEGLGGFRKQYLSEFLHATPNRRHELLQLAAAQIVETCDCKTTSYEVAERRGVDYAILTVSDLADESRMVEALEDARRDAHLVGLRPPLVGRVRLRARVDVHPRTRDLYLVAREYKELEGRPKAPTMDEGTMKNLGEAAGLPMDSLRQQVAPDMVGRPLVQEARLLVLLSPWRIPDVDGRPIRGTLIEGLFGDTTTNKSESAMDTARRQGFGPVVQAENASRTGITYNITERRDGSYSLSWGALPRNHRRYVLLDGLERWSSRTVGDLRAALRDQMIEVDRVVHGRRPAAVRLTLTFNPRKPMREYAYRCQAILDSSGFENPPDIARVDFWHPFAKEDVPDATIAHRETAARPVDEAVFRDWTLWAWSLEPEVISYLPAARVKIQDVAARLMGKYGTASIPVAHLGLRETVCRVAASYASLSFATTNGRDLVIAEPHVAKAEDFLSRMYEELELGAYRLHHEEDLLVTGGEVLDIVADVGTQGVQAIHHLHRLGEKKWMAAKDLAELLGGAWEAQKVRQTLYPHLTGWSLVETRSGGGARLTPKGLDFFRKVMTVQELFVEGNRRTEDNRRKESTNNSLEGFGESENGGDG